MTRTWRRHCIRHFCRGAAFCALSFVLGCGGGALSTASNSLANSATDANATTPLSPPEQGIATYYAADGTGACMFDPSPSDLDVAAMDSPEWNNSGVCGECVHVKGPSGEVTVRIVDLCPECETGHLDLSQEAFAKIADVSLGRVPITWQGVRCDVVGNVAYRYKEGSSQWWTAIQVRNHRLPIVKLEFEQNGSWVDIPRASYNYFVVSNGVGTTNSFRVRVTASDGQSLIDTLPGVQEGVVTVGAGQFN